MYFRNNFRNPKFTCQATSARRFGKLATHDSHQELPMTKTISPGALDAAAEDSGDAADKKLRSTVQSLAMVAEVLPALQAG